jgi:branched-chain amino acid transport system ATP-binding protein
VRLLEVRGVTAGYGRMEVLHGVDLDVGQGEMVCVIGSNGAGKTTLLRTISGLIRPSLGHVRFDGRDITRAGASRIVAMGITHVPENRRIFPLHSVEENLIVGGFVRRRDRSGLRADIDRMCQEFPILGQRRKQLAGTLSGGEQQMLAIAMGLMAHPRLLILDEPSLGLAPILVEKVFEAIRRLRDGGTTILLAEQLAAQALESAHRGIVLQLGRVTAEGTAEELRENEGVVAAYLGA